MTIIMGQPSYFQTRHCPTSNFHGICYTEMQKHTCTASVERAIWPACNGNSELLRSCAPYLVARRYYHAELPSAAPSAHHLR